MPPKRGEDDGAVGVRDDVARVPPRWQCRRHPLLLPSLRFSPRPTPPSPRAPPPSSRVRENPQTRPDAGTYAPRPRRRRCSATPGRRPGGPSAATRSSPRTARCRCLGRGEIRSDRTAPRRLDDDASSSSPRRRRPKRRRRRRRDPNRRRRDGSYSHPPPASTAPCARGVVLHRAEPPRFVIAARSTRESRRSPRAAESVCNTR